MDLIELSFVFRVSDKFESEILALTCETLLHIVIATTCKYFEFIDAVELKQNGNYMPLQLRRLHLMFL